MRTRNVLLGLAIIVIVAAIAIYAVNILMFKPRYERRDAITKLLDGVSRAIYVYSDSFNEGAQISSEYTCDWENKNPHISWSGVPPDTRSIAILIYDKDSPGDYFIHWIVVGIPPDVYEVAEGIYTGGEAIYGVEGRNDFGYIGYGGPCPPPGEVHNYFVLVLALDREIILDKGYSFEDFIDAVKGHVIVYGETRFVYSRAGST